MAEAKHPKGDWDVVRQDSNGAQTRELEGVDEATARAHAEQREKQIGFHKQTVWPERRTPKPS